MEKITNQDAVILGDRGNEWTDIDREVRVIIEDNKS